MSFRSAVRGKKASAIEQIVVLDPQWLSNIFRAVISFKGNFIQAGILDHRNLIHIWRPPEHTTDMHQTYLGLLEKTEITFPMRRLYGTKANDLVEKSLVPSLLPDESPSHAELEKLGWKPKSGTVRRLP